MSCRFRSFLLLFILTGCGENVRFRTENSTFEMVLNSNDLVRTDNQILFVVDDSKSMVEEIRRLEGGLNYLVNRLNSRGAGNEVNFTLHMAKLSDFQPQDVGTSAALNGVKIASGKPEDAPIVNFLNSLTAANIDAAAIENEPGIAAALKAMFHIYGKWEIKGLIREMQSKSTSPLPEVLQSILEGRSTLKMSAPALNEDPELSQLNLLQVAEDVERIRNLAVIILSDEDNTLTKGTRPIYVNYATTHAGYKYTFRRPTRLGRKLYSKQICALGGDPSVSYSKPQYTCGDALGRTQFDTNSNHAGYSYCKRPINYLCTKTIDGVPVTYTAVNKAIGEVKTCTPDLNSGDKFEVIKSTSTSLPGVKDCSAFSCTTNYTIASTQSTSGSVSMSPTACAAGYVLVNGSNTYEVGKTLDMTSALPPGITAKTYIHAYTDHTFSWPEKLSSADALQRFRDMYPGDELLAHFSVVVNAQDIQTMVAGDSVLGTKEAFLEEWKKRYPELKVSFHSFVSEVDGTCSAADLYPNQKGTQYIALSQATKGLVGNICKLNFDKFVNSLGTRVLTADKLNARLPVFLDLVRGRMEIKASGRLLKQGQDWNIENGVFVTFEEGSIGPNEEIVLSYTGR